MKKIIFLIVLIAMISFGYFSQTTPEEMQKIIDANGGGWQAKWTPYSNLTPEELQGLLGYNDNYNGHILLVVTANRNKGKPETDVQNFVVLEEGDYFINVINGDEESKDTKVSSAAIELGSSGEVFSPSDFNKNVNVISKSVHLASGDYSLVTTTNGQPGSFLTIIISTFDISSYDDLP